MKPDSLRTLLETLINTTSKTNSDAVIPHAYTPANTSQTTTLSNTIPRRTAKPNELNFVYQHTAEYIMIAPSSPEHPTANANPPTSLSGCPASTI